MGVSGSELLKGTGLLLWRRWLGWGGGEAGVGLRLGVDLREVRRAEMREAAPAEDRKEERAGEAAEGVCKGVGPGVETVGAVEFVGEWKDWFWCCGE